mmetsp:Transcript_140584/g.244738  ORF Transcript_140584/g.244738 Transcript_140584/m.244738 type:complete len:609 (+) Transcript_140584:280-2106(+)
MGTLEQFAAKADLSWVKQLKQDPDAEKNAPNRTSRQVLSGHYVHVNPTPLPGPELVMYSKEMAQELGLSNEACTSDQFAAFFTGDTAKLPPLHGKSWATPYALSIYGQEMYQNCPFGNGNGYGDGRAISIAEVLLENGKRWELQLKGGGRTPWCRGADGRAVLRSSVREFLVSEAMHHMGVQTTRALSLVMSHGESISRPWYSNENKPKVPAMDDPRLAQYPPELRKALLAQVIDQYRQPDRMVQETCAITTRVAPSFFRVGHMELFRRRVQGERARPKDSPAYDNAVEEHRMLVQHALFREYPECVQEGQDLQPQVLCMLRAFSNRLATLTADWIRVGFVQGNFNSDNCLIGGRTMDYGPFGFVQRFQPLWNMWVGGGQHYGFLNQPVAGAKNFGSFVQGVLPVLDEEGKKEAGAIFLEHEAAAQKAVEDVWRRKLGLKTWDAAAAELLESLLVLMEEGQADYPLLWRQLAELPAAGRTADDQKEALLGPLEDVFYAPLTEDQKQSWVQWLQDWLEMLKTQGLTDGAAVAEGMRNTSPKYVPREWMLVQAYTAANNGDFSLVHELHDLFKDPFGKAEDTRDFEKKYYRKAPAETYEGAGIGGAAYMS